MSKNLVEYVKNNQILVLLLLTFLFVAIRYTEFGSGDNNGQVPMLFRLADANYLENDWYVNVSDTAFNVRYPFHWLMLNLNFLIGNFEILYMLVFFVDAFFKSFFVFKLSKFFFKKKNIALLSVFLMSFGPQFALGGNEIFKTDLAPACLAVTFAIAGMYFFFKDKHLKAFAMIGFASLFQVLVGFHMFGIFTALLLLQTPPSLKNIKSLWKTLPFFIISSIVLVPMGLSMLQQQTAYTSEFITFIFLFRHPHHYMPSTWQLFTYFSVAAFLITGYIGLKCSKCDELFKKKIYQIVGIIALYYFLGFFFVEVFPIKLITKLQFFRVSIFLSLFGYMFIADYIGNRMDNSLTGNYFRLLPLAFLQSISLIPMFGLLYLRLFLKRVKNFDICTYFSERKVLRPIAVLAILAALFAPIYYQGIYYPAVALVAFVFAYVFIVFNDKKYASVLFTAAVLVGIIFIFMNPIIGRVTYEENLSEVYMFIQDETPEDAILLTPPLVDSFPLGANRAIIVDFKSMPFEEEYMVEWYERLKDVLNGEDFTTLFDDYYYGKIPVVLRESYASLGQGEVEGLVDKYDVSYAIFEKPKAFDYQIVFENDRYVVYSLGENE